MLGSILTALTLTLLGLAPLETSDGCDIYRTLVLHSPVHGYHRGVTPGVAPEPPWEAAQHFIAATACQEADYSWMIRHYCLKQFQLSMEGIGRRLWCDWDETVGMYGGLCCTGGRWRGRVRAVPPGVPVFCSTYGELTNCTALIAERLDCYWPNRLVDEFFVAVHKQYFRNCSPSGRALHDPPNGVLCPFIVLPVLVTLLMTALVVWRSKRSEGIV
ncbi:hypothetical protein IHE44_0014224 [Lamprotornis superbus]|uniref:Receptor activity-modifying protein 1 n=1 Tax=Lamprotornis superbus TaxID=245042 RepID=A0A835TS31_9PASS|nr:hypothetical protein IHE44_0014224 [Lamprotornis superbus]